MTVEIVHPLDQELVDRMYAAALPAYLTVDRGRSIPWRRRAVDPARGWVAREHGRVVGTLRTIEDTVSVPGAPGGACPAVDADLLSLVSVSPTHRRRGLLTRMLGESLSEAREQGKAVSVLVAAEWPIYGRFGYAPAAFGATVHVATRRPGSRVRGERTGSLREIDAYEASALAPPLYDVEAAARPGVIGRDERWWDRELGRIGEDRAVVVLDQDRPARHVVHLDDAGGVDGYVRWSVARSDEDTAPGRLGELDVAEVLAATPEGYREIWRFLFGIDLVDTLHADGRPVDDPLPWLLADGRAATVREVHDAMWLRILDVPAALSARGYAGVDELVLEVVDAAVGGWAAGTWRLAAGPDGSSCTPAPGASPDVTLPQATLASLYLGGVRAAVLARAGGLDEHTPGATARLDRLFATDLVPWRGTDF